MTKFINLFADDKLLVCKGKVLNEVIDDMTLLFPK